MRIKRAIALLCVATVLYACFQVLPAGMASFAQTSQVSYSDKRMPLPAFELPLPQDQSQRDYLGLSGKGRFKIGDIKKPDRDHRISVCIPSADPCASRSEVYEKIEGRADLKEKIRMVGMAATGHRL